MKVSDAMTRQVSTAAPTDSIRKVAQVMAHVETGVVPVVENGKVVGLVTDRDIVLRVVGEKRSFDTRVEAVMTTDVQTCREDAPIADVIFQMTDKQVRRILIVDAIPLGATGKIRRVGLAARARQLPRDERGVLGHDPGPLDLGRGRDHHHLVDPLVAAGLEQQRHVEHDDVLGLGRRLFEEADPVGPDQRMDEPPAVVRGQLEARDVEHHRPARERRRCRRTAHACASRARRAARSIRHPITRKMMPRVRNPPGGMIMAWYPVKEGNQVRDFMADLAESGLTAVLRVEMMFRAVSRDGWQGAGLAGCGLVLVRPPWQLDTTLAALLPRLGKAMGLPVGGGCVEWLVPEGPAESD